MITMAFGIEHFTTTNYSPFLYPCSLPCNSVWSSSQPLMWLALANGVCTHLTRPIPSLGHKSHLMFLLAPIMLLPSPWEECALLILVWGRRKIGETDLLLSWNLGTIPSKPVYQATPTWTADAWVRTNDCLSEFGAVCYFTLLW